MSPGSKWPHITHVIDSAKGPPRCCSLWSCLCDRTTCRHLYANLSSHGRTWTCWPKKDPSLISRSYLFTRHVKPNNDRGKEIPDLSTIIQHRSAGMTFFLVNPRTIEHLLLYDFFILRTSKNANLIIVFFLISLLFQLSILRIWKR